MAVRSGGGWRLDWKGSKIQGEAELIAQQQMVQRMRVAEVDAKNRLRPGRGVETGTMKARTHMAPGGFNWASESIKPIPGGGPALYSHSSVMPVFIRGRYVLELGCGQWYAIYYHQNVDAFLRIPFEKAVKGLKRQIEKEWKRAFR